jgi:hypothetical protein
MAIDSLHFSVAALHELLRASHEQGEGCWSIDAGGRVFQFSVGSPRNVYVDETGRRGSGRHGVEALPLVAEVPVAFNHRDPDRLGDPGVNGTAMVNVAMLFEVPRHGGRVPQHLLNHYRVDCSSTRAADVHVHPANADTTWIAETIAQLVRVHYGGTYPLPDQEQLPFLPAPPVRLITRSDPSPQVVLVTAGPARADDAAVDEREHIPAVAFDPGEGARWIARVSDETLATELAKLEHAVRGLASNRGEEIEAPKASVEEGELVIRGSGAKTGRRELRVSLERPGNVNAGLIQTTAAGVPGGLGRDVAALAKELLVGAIGIPQHQLLPSRPLLVSRNSPLEMTTRLLHASLGSGSLLLHGAIQHRGDDPESVVADFTALRPPVGLLSQTCDASRSWAPGSEVVRLEWDFGDGTTAGSADEALKLVVTHEYKSEGDYEVTLTVTDARGRRASRTRTVSVGSLELEVSTPLVSDDAVATTVRILSGMAPVEGVRLTIHGEDLVEELVTDDDGAAIFEGAWAIFTVQPDSVPVVSLARDARIVAAGPIGESEWPVRLVHHEILLRGRRCAEMVDLLLAADGATDGIDSAYLAGVLRATKTALLNGSLPRWSLAGDDRGLDEPAAAIGAVEDWLRTSVDACMSQHVDPSTS